jgi:hypothetical protein
MELRVRAGGTAIILGERGRVASAVLGSTYTRVCDAQAAAPPPRRLHLQPLSWTTLGQKLGQTVTVSGFQASAAANGATENSFPVVFCCSTPPSPPPPPPPPLPLLLPPHLPSIWQTRAPPDREPEFKAASHHAAAAQKLPPRTTRSLPLSASLPCPA